jgi:hypothetical protein
MLDVLVGTYDLEASKTGLPTTTVKNVLVEVGRTTVVNVEFFPFGFARGRVADSASQAIPGATVIAKYRSNGTSAGNATAGVGGDYTIKLGVGDYDLTASMSGYQPQTKPATIVNAMDTWVNFTLSLGAGSGFVNGTVRGAEGEGPLANVSVEATGSGGSGTDTTGADGKYSISLNQGSYQLVFKLNGYATVTQSNVTVPKDPLDASMQRIYVKASVPADGATNVATNQPLKLTFSTAMNSADVESKVAFAPTVAPLWSWDATMTEATVAMVGLAPNTHYTVTVPAGVKEKGGGESAQAFEVKFTTGAAGAPVDMTLILAGVGIAVAAVVGLLLFMMMRKKKAAAAASGETPATPPPPPVTPDEPRPVDTGAPPPPQEPSAGAPPPPPP